MEAKLQDRFIVCRICSNEEQGERGIWHFVNLFLSVRLVVFLFALHSIFPLGVVFEGPGLANE